MITTEQLRRLRELEELEADGVELSAEACAELRDLLDMENAAFMEFVAVEWDEIEVSHDKD